MAIETGAIWILKTTLWLSELLVLSYRCRQEISEYSWSNKTYFGTLSKNMKLIKEPPKTINQDQQILANKQKNSLWSVKRRINDL